MALNPNIAKANVGDPAYEKLHREMGRGHSLGQYASLRVTSTTHGLYIWHRQRLISGGNLHLRKWEKGLSVPMFILTCLADTSRPREERCGIQLS